MSGSLKYVQILISRALRHYTRTQAHITWQKQPACASDTNYLRCFASGFGFRQISSKWHFACCVWIFQYRSLQLCQTICYAACKSCRSVCILYIERRYALRIMKAFACVQVRRRKLEESPMFLNLPNLYFVVAQNILFYNKHRNNNLWTPKVPQATRGALTSVGVWGAAILVRMLSCVAGCSSCGKTSSWCCETGRVQCNLCWRVKRWETGLQPASPLAGNVQCQCACILTCWAD